MKYLWLLIFAISNAAFSQSITYPVRASGLRIQGEVNVLYDINDSGRTENIRIIDATPEYIFERQVKKDVSLWRFQPRERKKDVPLKILFQTKRKH